VETTEPPIRCSVGITAHNEEANIGQLLEAICYQRLHLVEISEIIVVASGCTDRTEDIVREHAAHDPRIQLFVQEKREGKTSAINIFLANAREAAIRCLTKTPSRTWCACSMTQPWV
jgi:glycosyltransferase involved in cell wall biosynthesis